MFYLWSLWSDWNKKDFSENYNEVKPIWFKKPNSHAKKLESKWWINFKLINKIYQKKIHTLDTFHLNAIFQKKKKMHLGQHSDWCKNGFRFKIEKIMEKTAFDKQRTKRLLFLVILTKICVQHKKNASRSINTYTCAH